MTSTGVRARAVVGKGDRLIAFYTSRAGRHRAARFAAPLLAGQPTRVHGAGRVRPARRDAAVAERQAESPRAPRDAGQSSNKALPTSLRRARPSARSPAIWGHVVDVPAERVGRQTHFFDIGGHSLSAMRVLARIKDSFRVELGVSQFFDEPRLDSIAAAIDREIARRPPSEREAQVPTVRRAPKPRAGSGLLENKVALVTGGSRGIGLAIALLLAEHGAKVAINYRDSEAQARLAKEQIEAEGGTAEVFEADVTNAEDVAKLVEAVHQRFDQIDILAANAHLHFRHRPFVEYEWTDLERKVTDELKALFYPCQAVAPEMLRRKSGSIVAVSSSLSKHSQRGVPRAKHGQGGGRRFRARARRGARSGRRTCQHGRPRAHVDGRGHADVACREGEDRRQLPHAPQRVAGRHGGCRALFGE